MLSALKSSQKKQFFIEIVNAYAEREDKPSSDGSQVFLNCPSPVLDQFKKTLSGTPILGAQYLNPYTREIEELPTDENKLTARHLQILARNEHVNVDGIMNTALYCNLLSDDQIARIRCLVKATNISGIVLATHTGGYRHTRYKFDHPIKNILIDQAGLQWQGDFRNTGGLHFYPDDPLHPSLPESYQRWQDDMYEAMYSVKRPSTHSKNSLKTSWNGVPGFLDLDSVSNALATEFSQALEAAVFQGARDLKDTDRINFRFCRAGMGFFVSGLSCNKSLLRVARLKGIAKVLENINGLPSMERAQRIGKIGRIVLPHSNEAPYSDDILAHIGELVKALGLEWGGAPEEDSFKPEEGYVNATTNCADPHAMPGNEGGPCSVDACISYNANINTHNAAFNKHMQIRNPLQNDYFHDATVLKAETPHDDDMKLSSLVKEQGIFRDGFARSSKVKPEVPTQSPHCVTM